VILFPSQFSGPVSQHPVPFEASSVPLVSSHRYSALAVWSPLARQNGALTGRRQNSGEEYAQLRMMAAIHDWTSKSL
jgi:hypothetical protein